MRIVVAVVVAISNYRLSVDALILLIHRAMVLVVKPWVTVVDDNFVESMQVSREVTTTRQHLCRHPTAIVRVVEQCSLDIVVEVEFGEIVVHCIVITRRTPRRLQRDIYRTANGRWDVIGIIT